MMPKLLSRGKKKPTGAPPPPAWSLSLPQGMRGTEGVVTTNKASADVDGQGGRGDEVTANAKVKKRSPPPQGQGQGHQGKKKRLSLKRRPSSGGTNTNSPLKRRTRALLHQVALLKESNEYYKEEMRKMHNSYLLELTHLQEQNESLSLQSHTLSNDLAKWKKRAFEVKGRNAPFLRAQVLQKEKSLLEEDLEICKSVVGRLSQELMKSQTQGQYLEGPPSSGDNHAPLTLPLPPLGPLTPLLQAYDEVIKEKDDLIRNHEDALSEFKVQVRDVVRENRELHKVVSERGQGSLTEGPPSPGGVAVAIEEWSLLHTNALLVLEENDILQEKVRLLKKKEELVREECGEKVRKLRGKVNNLEEEKRSLGVTLTSSEGRVTSLVEQQAKLSAILEKRIPQEQHEASVTEVKRAFEDLKKSYESERSSLLSKLSLLEEENKKLSSISSESDKKIALLSEKVVTLEGALSTSGDEVKGLYSSLLEARRGREASNQAMEEVLEASQKLFEDRRELESRLNEQKQLNQNLLVLREKQVELVNQLQRKIREMEELHTLEIQKLIEKVADNERNKELFCLDHQQKIAYLEDLSEERNRRIGHLETEKKQLQQDLETVWKTTTSTIREVRGEVRT